MIPGEYRLRQEPIICNQDRKASKVMVLNQGDRPIQIGSHFHFYEVNSELKFERDQAFGRHLNIPAGTAVRFEPGDAKEVELVPFAGQREVYGLNNKTDGPLDQGERNPI
ncbi:urease subunit beta [Bacillus sp. ISL-7]|uniref:urease subunit beta n=1 Tax=Bacillus sp. ISL-7 TaxID=2819136 RepID=UPI001BE7FC87|nr:urease subunit beta [Bacillus sp. ISL-7]MBT2736840.1 urease subunit beta [Bacillus sp. ISL-7]